MSIFWFQDRFPVQHKTEAAYIHSLLYNITEQCTLSFLFLPIFLNFFPFLLMARLESFLFVSEIFLEINPRIYNTDQSCINIKQIFEQAICGFHFRVKGFLPILLLFLDLCYHSVCVKLIHSVLGAGFQLTIPNLLAPAETVNPNPWTRNWDCIPGPCISSFYQTQRNVVT
jgi:hypothetical protein